MAILIFFILANYPFKETYNVSFLKSNCMKRCEKWCNGKSKMMAYLLPKQNGFEIQLLSDFVSLGLVLSCASCVSVPIYGPSCPRSVIISS